VVLKNNTYFKGKRVAISFQQYKRVFVYVSFKAYQKIPATLPYMLKEKEGLGITSGREQAVGKDTPSSWITHHISNEYCTF